MEPVIGKYGFEPRSEMVRYVPAGARVLDVGCASGGFAHALRGAGHSGEIWGIEPDEAVADQAREHVDHLVTGLFPDDLPAGERFDAVVFNDVLEHLVDPWETLRQTAPLLRPGGRVIASIPNIRYWPVLRRLVTHGQWTYTETGTLDRTHLRFFTRSSIADLFAEAGYSVSRLDPVNVLVPDDLAHAYIRVLPMGMRAMQYAVVAHVA